MRYGLRIIQLKPLWVLFSRIGHRERDQVYTTHRIGKESWLYKAKEAATRHYFNSITKLVDRLTQKGIGINFDIRASRLGVNFDMLITDNDSGKTVKAWTIVASGPIQKPHYRYLVK